jgi:hypothetical protein
MVPRAVCSASDRGSHRISDQNLLSRAPPCFGRQVKPLVSVALAVVSTHSSFKEAERGVRRQKHVVPTPLSGIRVGRRR